MRKSVRKDDPGYDKNAFNYKVFVDGVETKQCFTADEEKGIAFCYQTDSNGKFILNENKTEIKTIEKKGIVRVVCK